MSLGWGFQSVIGGKVYGINESGMEIFKGTPFKSLAREICQNSLDAVNDKTMPVEVDFQIFDMPISGFPDKAGYREALDLIEIFYRNNQNRKVKGFVKRAKEILTGNSIRCLRVSDTNTVGLIGSANVSNHFTPWSNLVMSTGVSEKGDTAGGSFGIGKSAPFACSEIRTVFYSTIDIEGHSASQGVARLISFKKPDESIAVGEGYFYDTELCVPIPSCLSVDRSYSRSVCGTDLFIFAFDSDDNWEAEVFKSVIDGFMLALIEKRLNVRVGQRVISAENLDEYVLEYGAEMPHTKNYYEVMTSQDTVVFNESPLEFFAVLELSVLVKNGLHGKAAYFRSSGMKIQDRGNVSSFIPFAAVMILRGERINKYFRDMESVSHDKWEPSRVEGANARKRAAANLKALYKFVKDVVSLFETDSESSEIEAEGIGEYLPDDVSDDAREPENPQETISDKVKSYEVEVVKKPVKTGGTHESDDDAGNSEEDSTGVEDDTSDEDESEGRAPKGKPNENQGGLGTPTRMNEDPDASLKKRKPVRVKPSYIRLLCSDVQKREYLLYLTPVSTISEGYIEVRISGELGSEPAHVKEAWQLIDKRIPLSCIGNKIHIINVPNNDRSRFSFTFEFSEQFSLEVFVYGYTI